MSVPSCDGNGRLSHDEDAEKYRKANEVQVMMTELMLTFIKLVHYRGHGVTVL